MNPQKSKNTLFHHLAQNPDLVNTPKTHQEHYRDLWKSSLHQSKATIEGFLKAHKLSKSSTLTGYVLIGVTKFAMETCERLVLSKLTDLDWLSANKNNIGMEVCAKSISKIIG